MSSVAGHNISSILFDNAARRPGATAVIYEERGISYGELLKRSIRLANGLSGIGVKRGDRVAVLSTNNADYVMVVFALGMIGAVWVPLNFRLAPPELTYIVNDCEASTVVYSADMQGSAAAVAEQAPAVRNWICMGSKPSLGVSLQDLVRDAGGSFGNTGAAPDELFTIMYTSGTTGRPKGVMLTHRAFLRGTEILAAAFGALPEERYLQIIPQFHAGGQIYQLAHMLVGATVVVAPRFEPDLILDLMERHAVHSAGFVPTMLMSLLESPRMKSADFSQLRRVMYGGSPIPEDRLALAVEVMKAGFQQTYGQTEIGVIVSVLDAQSHLAALRDRPQLLQSCGRPLPGYDVRLIDDDGRDVVAPEVGELLVAGESLMQGYWHLPEATANSLRGRWLHTGDMARADDQGYLYIVDRRSDMIISGGENIYPIEIEHVISAHPDVLDVAVIGVPDDLWGEAVRAVVALRPGATGSAESIRDYCRAKLAGFKLPKQVDFVDAIPRNASGKILKAQLREKYWSGRSRRV